ncbi:MAG: trypsin-like peptidase domain-containing protein [Paenibacillaceae bacterium]|nr:trypsin-like peptidase domain-containing protein [Paenibacillaceae bacterium]
MEDNKKGYDDFFERSPEKDTRSERDEADAGKAEKPSYYYSYGPYKSSMQDDREEHAESYESERESQPGVEMTPPKPVRPMFGYTPEREPQQPTSTWTVNEPRRRSGVRTAFTAFVAGALVVGSLMFTADKMNLFTGDQGVLNSGGSGNGSSVTLNNSSGDGAPKTTSLDVVRPNNIADIVENASPAVVKIETYVKQQSRSSSGGSLFDDPFFRQFFGDNGGGSTTPKQNQKNQTTPNSGQLQEAGMGSGFIFEKSGYILTNEHVIDGADEIRVTVQGYDKPFTAKLLGNSYDLDLAVLKIEGDKDFAILPMGKADQVAVGDWVVAIGNPYGFDHTVTVGVLSAKERPISIPDEQGTRNYQHLLQTDASINPGNSGGPLLNLNGEVIGINTAVSSQAQGIGFAIPTNTIDSVLENLKNNVEIPKEPAPYIGISMQDIDQSYLSDLQLSSTDGTLVMDVTLSSPAFKAGVKKYDVITSVNGEAVKNSTELQTKVRALKVGDKATLGIVRDGKKMDITVTIGDQNKDTATKK